MSHPALPLRPIRAVLTLALAIGLPALPTRALTAQARPRDPLAGLDAYVERGMRDWQVPGLAMVVVQRDSVTFMRGFGVRELGKPGAVGVHTKFGNMSTTKAFTAMVAAMLADSGRLAFDDPVTRHIPELRLADPYVTREITLRDLLTHRLGFGDPGYLWSGSGFTYQQVIPRLALIDPQTSFRSQFAYNNVGYALVGDAEARAAGSRWQALVHQRILEPLGMTETVTDGAELRSRGGDDVTSPHGIVRDTVRVLSASPSEIDAVAPAGSMYSTAYDMAKWLRFLLDTGRVNGKRLVSARNFTELFTPQAMVPPGEFYPTARLTKPHIAAYGMGWFMSDYRGEWITFHTGSIEGRSAIVGLVPDRRIGVAIFTNLDHSELRHALMYTVFDRYIGLSSPGAGHDWSAEMRTMYGAMRDSARVRRERVDAKRIIGTKPTLPMERYLGTYADTLYGTVTLTRDGDRIRVKAGDQQGTLDHWQYDIFRVTWDDPFQGTDLLQFVLDRDASPSELRVVGSPYHFRRRPSS